MAILETEFGEFRDQLHLRSGKSEKDEVVTICYVLVKVLYSRGNFHRKH